MNSVTMKRFCDFIIICGVLIYPSFAQVCIIDQLTEVPPNSTTVAIGASFSMSIRIHRTPACDSKAVQINGATAAIHRTASNSITYTAPWDATRLSLQNTLAASSVTFSITLLKAQASDIGSVFTVAAGIQTSDGVGPINVTNCGNSTLSGVKQNVPDGKIFMSNHTFSCMSGYEGNDQFAICQADGTWNLTSFCEECTCNHTSIPANISYEVPQSGSTPCLGTFNFTCSGNFDGIVSALCTGKNTWSITINCHGICNSSTIPSDISYTHSLSSVVSVSESVNLTCNTGYTENAMATCIAPGTWDPSTCLAECVVPPSGNMSATYCSSNGSVLNIIEGTPNVVHCCNDASKNLTANCAHDQTISTSLSCEVTTTPPASSDPTTNSSRQTISTPSSTTDVTAETTTPVTDSGPRSLENWESALVAVGTCAGITIIVFVGLFCVVSKKYPEETVKWRICAVCTCVLCVGVDGICGRCCCCCVNCSVCTCCCCCFAVAAKRRGKKKEKDAEQEPESTRLEDGQR